LVAGRLTLEEFAERVDVAYGARTAAELQRAREGLPAPLAARSGRPPVRLSGALFGRAIRRGRLLIRRRTTIISAAADVDLDLREAEIEGGDMTVAVFVAFGNVDVYVPQGIDVTADGLIVFGRQRHWGRDTARPGAPTARAASTAASGRWMSGACLPTSTATTARSSSSSKSASGSFPIEKREPHPE
jgi:hypothetical protein